MNELSETGSAPWSEERTQAPGRPRPAQGQPPQRSWCGVDTAPLDAEALDSAPRAPQMPSTAHLPSSPPSEMGGSLPAAPHVGGVGSSWENRLGAAPPLGRGGRHLAGSPGWQTPLPLTPDPRARTVCSLHALPSPALPACHGRARRAPDPGPVGHRRKRHLRNQVSYAPDPSRCPEGRARGLPAEPARPPAASGRSTGWSAASSALGHRSPPEGSWGTWAVLSHQLGCLGCLCPSGRLSTSVCQRGPQATGLPDTGLDEFESREFRRAVVAQET